MPTVLRCDSFLLLTLLLTAPCGAQEARGAPAPRARMVSRLVYEVPAVPNNCPAEAVLEAAVVSRLGYPAFDPSASAVLMAKVEMDAAGLVGRVSLQTEGRTEGVRELRTSSLDCNELIQSLALAISVALDPLLEVAEPAPPLASADPTPPLPSAAPASGPAPSVGSTPLAQPTFAPARWRAPAPTPHSQASFSQPPSAWQLEAVVGASPSLLPRAAYSAELGLRYAFSGLEIGAGALAAWSPTLARSGNTGVQANALLGHAEVCATFAVFAACVPSYIGVVAAKGSGFALNYSKTELLATTGLGGSVRLDVSERWALQGGMAGLVSYAPLILKTDRSTLWQQPRWLTLFQAGAIFRL